MAVQKYRSIERIVDNIYIGDKRKTQTHTHTHKYVSLRQHMHTTDKSSQK